MRPLRYEMELPILYRMTDGDDRSMLRHVAYPDASVDTPWHNGFTHNVSASGVLFTTVDLVLGLTLNAPIEMRVLMPAELAGDAGAQAFCVGRIVRLVALADPHGAATVAATIARYRLSHSAGGRSGW